MGSNAQHSRSFISVLSDRVHLRALLFFGATIWKRLLWLWSMYGPPAWIKKHLRFNSLYRSLLKHPSAAAFANRAMVRLKKDDFEGAQEDSSAALELDPMHIKSWQRRGTARRMLGMLLEAAQDFEEALRCLLTISSAIGQGYGVKFLSSWSHFQANLPAPFTKYPRCRKLSKSQLVSKDDGRRCLNEIEAIWLDSIDWTTCLISRFIYSMFTLQVLALLQLSWSAIHFHCKHPYWI